MAGRLNRRGLRRRVGGLLVLLGVLLAHAIATLELARSRTRLRALENPPPPRLEVAFVRELVPAPPPPRPAAKPKPQPRRPAPASAEPVASAPEEAAPVVEPEPEPQAQAQAQEPPQPQAASAPEPAASEPAAPPFEWPPSTRLRYRVSGYWQGEIHGGAQVQWVRVGLHYQVHLDVWLGPSFAPLGTRRMTSDGELTADGLKPRRYDEATKVMFGGPRHATVLFEPGVIVLANGSRRDTAPGVQDTASQFVQLTWLFTTQPHLLRTGNTLELPVALPRRVYRWVYDVVGEERLHTPVGDLDTFHVKPRFEARGGDLTAQMWFAPTLQYLPVRIMIRQGADTYADMLLESPPIQAER